MKTTSKTSDFGHNVARREDAARAREAELDFKQIMSGYRERATRDQRDRGGDYYALREHEQWSLGNQLEHGARLLPHVP